MFDATVVITTRGRCDDLRRALQSCVSQTGVRLEIHEIDGALVKAAFDELRERYG